ncbi:MAG: DUF502 domain-containing protein [Chlamydiia bacterium]|nr:DUF502 domain-containing protein [Chlamydiia bacterium]
MKKTFLAGLVTLLPLAVTFLVVRFMVNFLTQPFLHLLADLWGPWLTRKVATQVICQIIILIALFFLTLFLGFVARRVFFNSLIKLGDRLLKKIPLVNKIYNTSKGIVRSLFTGKSHSFQQVVLLRFPYPQSYCLGLIASSAPQTASEKIQQEMVTVFIPTTPNPTTGYLVMHPRSELIFLKMKSEDAVKYIVSCGVIQPEKVQ